VTHHSLLYKSANADAIVLQTATGIVLDFLLIFSCKHHRDRIIAELTTEDPLIGLSDFDFLAGGFSEVTELDESGEGRLPLFFCITTY
jgi:hypothetical protein